MKHSLPDRGMVPSEGKGENRDEPNLRRRGVEKAMGSKRKGREDMGGEECARSEPHGNADDKCGDSPVGRCN